MASRLNIEDAIYIENDGQVGINVQSPTDQFEVNGTMSGNISTGDQWLKQQTGGANKTIHYMSNSSGAASITKYGDDLRFENPHDTVRATLDNGGTFSVLGASNLNSLNVTGNFSAAYGKVQMDSTAVYFEQQIIQLGAYPTLNKAIIDSQGSNIRLSSPGNTGALTVDSSGDTILLGHIKSKGAYLNSSIAATDSRPALTTSSIGDYEIRGYGTNGTGGNEGFLRLSSGGGSNTGNQTFMDLCGYNTNSDMDDTITMGTRGTEKMRISGNGDIGIGTDNPGTLLDLATPSITKALLTIRGGNGSVAFNDGAQIQFGYSGNDSYNHYIHTRHNSTDSYNAIDFYLCDGTENNTLTSGSAQVMSLVSGKVGIKTTTPNAPLHVKATGDIAPNNNGLYVWNETNSANQHAIVAIRTAGSSGGNPYISFDVASEAGWSVGMDNADNKFKFGSNWDSLTSNTRLTIDHGTGNIEVGGSVYSSNRVVHYRDEKTNGTHGGNRVLAAAYFARTLNVRYGDTSFTTFTNNQITFTVTGTYRISARCPGYRINRHMCKLRQVDDASGNVADLFFGSSQFSNTNTPAFMNDSTFDSIFDITNGDVIELQHYCQSGTGTHDLGVNASSGGIEVYAEMWIERLN